LYVAGFGEMVPLVWQPANGNAALRLLALFIHRNKKSGPISRAALKEAREGGKVREGDAYGSAKQNLHGVESVRRELKSFPVERPLLLLLYVALTTPNRELIDRGAQTEQSHCGG
jgi:hypothetical protein